MVSSKNISSVTSLADVLPPWDSTVSEADKAALTKGTYSLANPNYYPIYTLISATGYSTKSDCYAIVKTASDYDDWKLQVDINATPYFRRAYIMIDRDRNDTKNIHTSYSGQTPPQIYANPVTDALIEAAKAKK
jgi:hypothetical protein